MRWIMHVDTSHAGNGNIYFHVDSIHPNRKHIAMGGSSIFTKLNMALIVERKSWIGRKNIVPYHIALLGCHRLARCCRRGLYVFKVFVEDMFVFLYVLSTMQYVIVS
jgi:hypothetical protein